MGAWVAGVLYVSLFYRCGTAVRGGCGWVVGAFDFLDLHWCCSVPRAKHTAVYRLVSSCLFLVGTNIWGAVSSVSVATRTASHIAYVSRSRHPALREMGFGT